MINLTIDGQKLQTEEGRTILEVASDAGIYIPTLCYHKALSPYGACRICLVEIVEGARTGIQASCIYPVEEGTVVRTDTERVIRTRRIMIELLLARCPDSERIKALAEEFGVKETRIKKKNEDCILCGLCVRMCRERMGPSVVSFAKRGIEREVSPPYDKRSEICMGCGACEFICPTGAMKASDNSEREIKVLGSEFDWAVGSRPAVNILYPQAVPNVPVIDKEHCVYLNRETCQICRELCGPEAIDFEQKEEVKQVNVGAVIVAAGYDRFNPYLKLEYNYDRCKNVITSPEFERILSASGPFQGHLVRPSDKKEPKRIAFLLCVGSRDVTTNPYCSSVCCMYATKEAVVAKEHAGKDLQTHIYFMDIRAQGKGFDRYYERAKEEYGVDYRPCRLAQVEEVPASDDLLVKYLTEEGKLKNERYDMVILSTGLVPPSKITEIKERLNLGLNQYSFIGTNGFFKEMTQRQGVYVCGALQEPKDIPESVIQASSASSCASGLLADVRGTLVKEKVYPQEKDITEQLPRIGVFVCHCGINIAGVVDVEGVVNFVKTLPNVAYCEANLYTCSQDTQERIKQMIQEHNLNRIVISACTPRTHEPLFQDTIREAGLNPFLLEFVSIRELCSWVHMDQKDEATEKSKELVSMAVAKAGLLSPLRRASFSVNKKALVVGGGISGMAACLSLADQGFEVYLVEREDQLGGNLKELYFTLDGSDPQALLVDTIREVEENKKIHVYKNAEIWEFAGYVGNYKTKVTLKDKKEQIEIEHGVVVVATGAKEKETDEYLYGKSERVITQKQLEEKLSQPEAQTNINALANIVMIQCVGSRENDSMYCSRVCCAHAIKNALKVKEINPDINIYVLYRDIRTYGFKEEYYQKARDKGVIFIRYELQTKPVVTQPEGQILSVEVFDPILARRLRLTADLLVLSTGIGPNEGAEALAKLLKVPLNEDGFFLEAHIKLRPVDFSADGLYLCGMAHSPKFVDESISQARAAAGRAVTLLAKDAIQATGRTVEINERLCAGCGICVTICPYDARELDEVTGKAKVIEVLCQGCGACVVACPNGATQQFGFTKRQLLSSVDELCHVGS